MAKKSNENQNLLIKEDKRDTINEIHAHLEWLCVASSGDDSVPTGLIQSLNMVRAAVKSLKEPETT